MPPEGLPGSRWGARPGLRRGDIRVSERDSEEEQRVKCSQESQFRLGQSTGGCLCVGCVPGVKSDVTEE